MSISYNKRVIELNKKHILGFMTEQEFTDTIKSKLQCNYLTDFRQVTPVIVFPTVYNAIIEMTFDGDFLCYTSDVQNYLNNVLCINPQHKEYTCSQSMNIYASLLARDGEKLYKHLIEKGARGQ